MLQRTGAENRTYKLWLGGFQEYKLPVMCWR